MIKKETLIKQILEKHLASIKRRNPKYSLRKLAKSLNISPATLSRILTGKGNLSKAAAAKIIQVLPITDVEKSKLLEKDHDPYQEVEASDEDLKDLINEWYYSGIVCLAEMKDFNEDPRWIAERLNISVVQAELALAGLQRIGFLKRNDKGKLVPVDIAISTKGKNLKSFPDKNLLDKNELVRENLNNPDEYLKEISDISSIIVGCHPRKLPEARKRLQRFRRSLAKFLDSGEKSEVYLIYMQLIPISTVRKKKS